MTTLTQARRRSGRDQTPLPADGERLPPRPRRRWLNPASAALLALVTCAIGFYVGVRVEKSRVGSTSAAAVGGGFAARASAAAGGSAGATGAGATGDRGSASGAGRARSGNGSFAAGGFPAGGFAARPGGGSEGTVSSVDGHSFVLKETSGDTVKVKLTSATKVTKSMMVAHGQIRPGDTITVSGVTDGAGTIAAASVSDSGAASSAASSGSTAASGTGNGSGSSGSGVGSLFSSGG